MLITPLPTMILSCRILTAPVVCRLIQVTICEVLVTEANGYVNRAAATCQIVNDGGIIAELHPVRRAAAARLLKPSIVVKCVGELSQRCVTDELTDNVHIVPDVSWSTAGWMCVDASNENIHRVANVNSYGRGNGESSDTFALYIQALCVNRPPWTMGERARHGECHTPL